MDKLYFRITQYCTNKYEEIWDDESNRVTKTNSDFTSQKTDIRRWLEANSLSYYGIFVRFYEMDLFSGEVKLLDALKILNLKPKPRVLNNDSSSNSIEKETNDSELG